jgi:hypothetical protein
VALAAVAALLLLLSGRLPGTFPVMVLLGPLLVGQYAKWIRLQGRERTMVKYRLRR